MLLYHIQYHQNPITLWHWDRDGCCLFLSCLSHPPTHTTASNVISFGLMHIRCSKKSTRGGVGTAGFHPRSITRKLQTSGKSLCTTHFSTSKMKAMDECRHWQSSLKEQDSKYFRFCGPRGKTENFIGAYITREKKNSYIF